MAEGGNLLLKAEFCPQEQQDTPPTLICLNAQTCTSTQVHVYAHACTQMSTDINKYNSNIILSETETCTIKTGRLDVFHLRSFSIFMR